MENIPNVQHRKYETYETSTIVQHGKISRNEGNYVFWKSSYFQHCNIMLDTRDNFRRTSNTLLLNIELI